MLEAAEQEFVMSSPGDEEASIPPAVPPHSSRAHFWLRELPYAAILVLTIFGIAYTSYAKEPIVGYWEFLAPVIGLACIASGWAQAGDRRARLRLIGTQALHWLAFVAAMNLVLLASVQEVMNANATGLAILMLLALGAFTAGVHIFAWQICLVGAVMALGVPAIAWMEESALFLGLGTLALLAIGALAFWRRFGRVAARQNAPPRF
jgi:hypothetical protein